MEREREKVHAPLGCIGLVSPCLCLSFIRSEDWGSREERLKKGAFCCVAQVGRILYRDEIYSLQILVVCNTQAEPGRTFKQEQEEISPNHVQRLNLISVVWGWDLCTKCVEQVQRLTKKACTWLRGFCSCSCLTALPALAWVLLSKIYIPFCSPL